MAAGALEPLTGLLDSSRPQLVRREAAFAIANLMAGGAGGVGNPEMVLQLSAQPAVLQAFLSLLRSA